MKCYIFAGALITTLILAFWGVGIGASARELDSVASRFSGASSPSEVIQLVNQLRKANGLPAYQVNSALMAAAQAHSEYQAAVGSVTHTGSGGSRPRDRAIAMGYGGGGAVFVSENIMGGNSMTAQKAVQWWQGDAPHLNTMLSPNYQDVGAGVAVSGSAVYITLDVGYIAGAAPPPPTD
ncbi:MAG: CAP domain-containing protein, partial [Anaerolineales bacterium]|nr:CAP domain-containing protein [Anaerolineales bacterium]